MKPKPKKATSNKRIFVPVGRDGWLAVEGYYTPQVQRVVKKWSGRVQPQFIETYFLEISQAASGKSNRLAVLVQSRKHWPLVAQLLTARIEAQHISQKLPQYWMLRFKLNTVTVGELNGWDQLVATIKDEGGPTFTAAALRKSAQRLHLVSPPKISAGAIRAFPELGG